MQCTIPCWYFRCMIFVLVWHSSFCWTDQGIFGAQLWILSSSRDLWGRWYDRTSGLNGVLGKRRPQWHYCTFFSAILWSLFMGPSLRDRALQAPRLVARKFWKNHFKNDEIGQIRHPCVNYSCDKKQLPRCARVLMHSSRTRVQRLNHSATVSARN